MMYKIFILLFISLFPFLSYGQLKNNADFESKKNKTHYSITTGAEVMRIGNRTIFGTYISPQVEFKVTPRFNINAGVIIGDFYSNDNLSDGQNESYVPYLPYFSNSFYVEGEYLLNSRVTLSGSTHMNFPNSELNQMNPLLSPASYKDYRLGIDYKISDGIHINAEVGFSNHPMNRYNRNLFQQYMFE